MSYQLGIDLGTTYTAAAVCRSSEHRWVEPEVVTLGTRSATVASVLFMAPDGAIVVGEAAERRALTDPDRVVREFKRRIGDPTPIVVAGRAWAPEDLSARLVRWVVDRVAEREGGPADRIAITHPASWGNHKKDLLAAALSNQGLTVTFLAEPQAAALHYAAAERVGAGSAIAVYDLGGGTFDAAVVRKGDPAAAAGAAGFGLLGRPEGLERLGGVDFDEVVFEHVREGMPAAFDQLDETDPAVLSAVSRVRRECTEAKEALSSDTEVSIPVLMPASRGSVRLHRSEFEAMIRPRVEETVAALRTAVASAGLAPEQLTAVLLVGGSSRIPLVAQLVSEQLGRPVAVDADPKNAIAKGAALAISPKPTASWPGVVIPPVPHGMAAPPARPPRPGSYQPAYAGPPPRPSGPSGPSHEPATSLLSSTSPQPMRQPQPTRQARPRPQPEPDWDYEPEPQQRRPVGLLVGIGGVLAVAAVIVAVLVWQDAPSSAGVGDLGGSGVSTSEDVVPTADPDAGSGSEPPPARDSGPGTGQSGGGPAGGDGDADAGGGTDPTTGPADPTEPSPQPSDEPEPPVSDEPDPPVDTLPGGGSGTSDPPGTPGADGPANSGGTVPELPAGEETPVAVPATPTAEAPAEAV